MHSLRFPVPGIVLALAVPLVLANSTAATTFVENDLYLISRSLPDSTGANTEGILRIDPGTGVTTRLYATGVPVTRAFDYDRFRDLLLFAEGTPHLQGISADGVVSTLVPGVAPDLLASRGDGLVYTWDASPGDFGYLDAANVPHDLLDASGTAPFNQGGVGEMIYDSPTNSLLVFVTGGAPTPCATLTSVCAMRIPLTPDGTQVAGALAATSVEVSSSGEDVVGAGRLPSGEVAFVVDTNSNAVEARLQLLDPATMTTAVYSNTGGFTGSAVISAGTYSTALGGIVIDDSYANILRVYHSGSSGAGDTLQTFGPATSGAGHSEDARFLEIHRAVGTAAPIVAHVPGVDFSAYPNPFDRGTTFSFRLPRRETVRLDIVDVRGRIVRAFAPAPFAAGEQRVRWDGRGDDGVALGSGVYFARARAGGLEAVRRLVLLR